MSLVVLIGVAIGLSLAMVATYFAQRGGRSGWIDVIWSLATGVASVVVIASVQEGSSGRQWLLTALVAFWSLRLTRSLTVRTLKSPEDPRYKAMREEWGGAAERNTFFVLQVQAIAAFALVLGVGAAATNTAPFPSALDWIAGLIALTALVGEAISDAQLARFRADPANKGKVCEAGLWGYSRHPNYFFEWLWWCTIPCIAFAGFSVGALAVLSFLPPAMMYLLLNYGSGIPPLERHMIASRGDAYREVQNRVNAFFPGPRRAGKGAQ